MAFETLGESFETLRERFGEAPEVPIRHAAIKLLASDTRLSILKTLDTRRMTVSELSRALDLNKSTVHEHLAKMVDGGLVRRDASEEREWVYYELTRTGKYILRPSNARFVLMMSAVIAAGLIAIAFLQVALVAGQGLAIQTDASAVPAGEGHAWDVQVTKPGFLGLRDAAPQSSLYLLTADQAARYQLNHQIPDGAHLLGPQDGLAQPWPGHFRFTSTLSPGVHYLLATSPASPGDGLLPVLAEPVQVVSRSGDVLLGLDPAATEVSVQFQGAPVKGGTLRAIDAHGEEVAAAPVVLGRASLALTEPSGAVRFEFKPQGSTSRFAPAQGEVRAVAPRVALEPSEVPIAAPAQVRVVVDDPLQGPRADAQVVFEHDGKVVGRGATDANGASVVTMNLRDPGPVTVKAGDRVVGTLTAKPGVRLWLEPGPHVQGQAVRVRTLLLGHEPDAVPGVHIVLNGRDVGVTDAKGELRVQFGLGGSYTVEARKDGYVAQVQHEDVVGAGTVQEALHTASALTSMHSGLVAGAEQRLQVPSLVLGQPAVVRAWVENHDSLPRVVRAELRLDGQVVAAQPVSLGPGRGQWVSFDVTPASSGSHILASEEASVPVHVAGMQAQFARSAVPGPEPWLVLGLAGVAALLVRRR